MAIKQAGIRFTEDTASCPTCGYPRLEGSASRQGANHLWVAYCPACRSVLESASIPDSFSRGLPAPTRRSRLH